MKAQAAVLPVPLRYAVAPATLPRTLALLVVTVFANALAAGFLFDDWADVVGNPAATAATFLDRLPETVRPLLKASYAVQDWLHGSWPAGFHAVNIALHAGAALLVFLLVARAARLSGMDGARVVSFACMVAALWAVHPALTETVTYVSGRSAGLSGLLMLAALALATGPASRAAVLGAGSCAALAPLARETALVLPVLLVLWQATLASTEPLPLAVRRLAPVLIGAGIGALVLIAMPAHRALVDFSLQARPPLDALRGNVHAIADILWLWLAPWQVSIDPAQPLAWGWLETPTLVRLAGLAGVAALAWSLRRRAPLAAFAVGWTLLCLVPTNSVIWRVDPVALKPIYLASLGPALLFELLLVRIDRVWRRSGAAIGLAVIIAWSALTMQRNALFADPVALWQQAVDVAPERGRPRVGLGYAWLDAGNLAEAERALNEGLAREPWSIAARRGLELLAGRRVFDAPAATERDGG